MLSFFGSLQEIIFFTLSDRERAVNSTTSGDDVSKREGNTVKISLTSERLLLPRLCQMCLLLGWKQSHLKELKVTQLKPGIWLQITTIFKTQPRLPVTLLVSFDSVYMSSETVFMYFF
jgi:hypothetical protein